MKLDTKQIMMGLTGFLVCWQATNFELDYRSVLSAIVAAGLSGANGKKTDKA